MKKSVTSSKFPLGTKTFSRDKITHYSMKKDFPPKDEIRHRLYNTFMS
ncbi:hypothetical protein HMPREF1869_01288 [Bacteroidales bacterium KA00251]|nr:hypothetical protein HMPREF1869_01288 [Bacteroidales bacterium KA00251]